MEKLRLSLLLPLFLLSFLYLNPTFSHPICCAGTSWQAVGPFVGKGWLAIDPNRPETLYSAGLSGGVFKSLNGGASWTDITGKLPYVPLTDLRGAVDSASKKTVLYALFYSEGVFKSIDGGTTWSECNNGLGDLQVSSIAIDPANSNTLYLASNQGVYKSTDGGNNWITLLKGHYQLPMVVLGSSQTIYVGDFYAGVLKSTDAGITWKPMNDGLGGLGVYAIAIDAVSSTTLYMTTYDLAVYRSTNGGSSWSPFSSGVPRTAIGPRMDILFDSSNSGIAYTFNASGIVKSCDGGSTWKKITPKIPAAVMAVAVHPSTPETIFAATGYSGIFISEDGGISWAKSGLGLDSDTIQAIAIARNGLEIFASTPNNIFKSTDGGKNWSPTTTSGSIPYATSIVVSPTSGGRNNVYAASNYYNGSLLYGFGVLKSSDDGATWNLMNLGLPADQYGYIPIKALAVDPGNPSIIYAIHGGLLQLYKSTNGGLSWALQSSLPAGISSVAVSVRQINGNSIVYAGTAGGVFISYNGGASWNASNTGLPTSASAKIVTIDPTNSWIVYAWIYNNGDHLYKSIDGGLSWKEFLDYPSGYTVASFAVDPVNSEILYAASYGGVIRTIPESAPAISVPASAYFSIGTFGSIQATTTGWPAPTISVSGQIPNGLSFDPLTRTLKGTPSVGSKGNYDVTFTASTGIPPDASRTVTVTVLPSPASLNVAISTPSGTAPLASLPAITGTASGPGLGRVDVQVGDGTYAWYHDGSLWWPATGTTSWSLDTSTFAFIEGITYTVTAVATSSDAQAVASRTFSIQQKTTKQTVILSAMATPETIKAGDTAAIRGNLTKADLTPLAGQTVTVIVTPPSTKENHFPQKVITSYTTDATGAFGGPSVRYATPGVYSVEVRFNGTGTLQPDLVNFSLPVVASSGYAIIVVGKASDDTLLDELTNTATAVYMSLRTKRGFREGNILQLISSSNTPVTKKQIRDALTSIKATYTTSPAPVYLIMVGHGNESGFLLGGTSSDLVLTPTELSLMLDDFERDVPAQTLAENRRFLIMGSCFSGQFQSAGSKQGRVVLTSAAEKERSLAGSTATAAFTDGGGDLYIDALFTFLDRGDSFAKAHVQAINDVTLRDPRNYNGSVPLALHSEVVDTKAQHPLLRDNVDSTGSFLLDGGKDGSVAANLFLGEGKRVPSTGDPADMIETSPTLFLEATDSTLGQGGIWLKVNDSSHVAGASVDIRTPDTYVETTTGTGQVIPGGLDSVTLTFDGEKWIDLTNHSFLKSGRYDIYYKVVNTETKLSPMAHSKVYKNKPSNTAPDPFTLTSPLNNATVDSSFGLSWTASPDRDKDDVSYTLLVSRDGPAPSSFDSHIIYTEEDIPHPQTYILKEALKDPAGGYYCRSQSCYWKVRAVDGYGMSTESTNINSFKVVDTNVGQTKIFGYVTNALTGVPISGATLTKNGTGEYKSLDDGSFQITAEAAASHDISATADGYTPASTTVVTAAATSQANLKLTPKGPQSQGISITTPAPAYAEYGTQFTVAATAPGGAVIYSSATPSICTNSGGTFTMLASSGTCIVQFDQGGGSNYSPAPRRTNNVIAAKRQQSISGFSPPPSVTYGDAAIPLSASATSGLPVTFTVVSGPATVSNNALSITGAGPITLKAVQVGDMNYAPATDVQQTIMANKAPLRVTVDDKSRPFGKLNPPLTWHSSGFVNNDSAAALTGFPSLSTTAEQRSPVGRYVITATQGSLQSANYNFIFVNGTLEVTPRGATVLPAVMLLLLGGQ